MDVPPSEDFLYRSAEARRIFTQPSLLGAALQCLRGEPGEQRPFFEEGAVAELRLLL